MHVHVHVHAHVHHVLPLCSPNRLAGAPNVHAINPIFYHEVQGCVPLAPTRRPQLGPHLGLHLAHLAYPFASSVTRCMGASSRASAGRPLPDSSPSPWRCGCAHTWKSTASVGDRAVLATTITTARGATRSTSVPTGLSPFYTASGRCAGVSSHMRY